MKKLLQINTVCNSGSTGRIAEDLARISSRYGWENYIVFGRNSRKSHIAKMYQLGWKYSSLINASIARILDNDGFLNSKNTQKLICYIDNIKPDIIHIHNLHGYYIDIRILFEYIKTKKIPTIITLHDCWLFTGHCTYFSACNCNKWQALCQKCQQKKSYPKSIFFDRSTENFLAKKQIFKNFHNLTIVPVSDWLSDLLSESFLKNIRKYVIKNGINLEVFKPQQPSDSFLEKYKIGNKFIIIGVANIWNWRKGLQDFLTLSKKLNNDEIIILVGLSERQKKYINANFKNIIPVTRTENIQELVELYSVSNVFFNPTYEDNYPTTNMEAQACGVPVVSYKTGGACESLDDVYCFKIKQGDLNNALMAIRSIKNLDKKTISQILVKKSRGRFDSSICFNKYISLYNKLLAEI